MFHWYIKINEAYKLNHIINIEQSDTTGSGKYLSLSVL